MLSLGPGSTAEPLCGTLVWVLFSFSVPCEACGCGVWKSCEIVVVIRIVL